MPSLVYMYLSELTIPRLRYSGEPVYCSILSLSNGLVNDLETIPDTNPVNKWIFYVSWFCFVVGRTISGDYFALIL